MNYEIEKERQWLILRYKVYQEKIKTAFRLFRENDIEPILIKGWAAAREYPEGFQRVFTDIDICVSPELFEKSKKLIRNEEGRKLNIDLHSGLRHLDTVSWENLFENSRLLLIDNESIRVLRPEDHLRVLCVHWLTDGGAYREKLLDFYYLIENYKADFDWERCLGVISPTRREWIVKTIGLTHKYYKLDIKDLPFAEEAVDFPDWLIDALEKEWSVNIKLKPIHTLLGNRREFWEQLKKRFPPNAIQATIDVEGKFDHRSRIYYQLGSIFVRLKPSLERVLRAVKTSILLKKGK